MTTHDASAFTHLRDNAFHVLGLKPEATRAEVEREGQKLLAQLQLGLAEAAHYATPLGPQPRDADAVRSALAALRDPRTRLQHALWARLPALPPEEPVAPAPAWPGALADMGCGHRPWLVRLAWRLAPLGRLLEPSEEEPSVPPPTASQSTAQDIEVTPPIFCRFLLFLMRFFLCMHLVQLAFGNPLFDFRGPKLVATVLLLFFPGVFVRAVFIPLGWPRAAVFLAQVSGESAQEQAVAAAWALLRAPIAGNEEFVQKKLHRLRRLWLAGDSLTVRGLLAVHRGELDKARLLLRAPRYLGSHFTSGWAQQVALDWLLADAASRGEWNEVFAHASMDPESPLLSRFFLLSVWRLRGHPLGTRFQLGLAWVLARRWWATWPLLRLAWTPPAPAALGGPPRTDPLRWAAWRHARLAQAPPLQRARMIQETASAWEWALDSAPVKAWVAEQARELGPEAATEALVTLEAQVVAELTAFILSHGHLYDPPPLQNQDPPPTPAQRARLERPPLEPGPLLTRALEAARQERLTRLEHAAEDLLTRVEERRLHAPRREWRQFLALHEDYSATLNLGDMETYFDAYSIVVRALTNLGVLLHEQGEPVLARGIWARMLQDARQLEVEDDQELLSRNLGLKRESAKAA